MDECFHSRIMMSIRSELAGGRMVFITEGPKCQGCGAELTEAEAAYFLVLEWVLSDTVERAGPVIR